MTKIRFTIELDFADDACAQRIHDDVNVHLTEDLHDLLRSYGHSPRSTATMDDLYGALTTEEVVDEPTPKEAMYQAALEAVGPTIAHATGAVIEEAGFFSLIGDEKYADHEVVITYPTTCGPSPRTVVTSDRGRYRNHFSDMTDEVWTCVRQALSAGLRPAAAGTDGGMVGPVSFLPITKGAAVVRIHSNESGDVVSYIAASEDDCRCNLSRFAYQCALEQGDTVTMGCVIAEPVRSAQGGAA